MKRIVFVIISLLAAFNTKAITTLQVGDPRNTWYTQPGSIEEAFISVKPRGAFVEYDLYLTFSSKSTNWNTNTDTVEVTLNFDLPNSSSIIDSWLWIEDDIIKGDILDRWTASNIYEGIVRRRKDPSILIKQSATQYQIKIFPMVGDSTRKIKINYLAPAIYTNMKLKAELPLDIIRASGSYLKYLKVITFPSDNWENPTISFDSTAKFKEGNDETFGKYYQSFAKVHPSNYDKGYIEFDSKITNGVYFETLEHNGENYYQLGIFPKHHIEKLSSKKIAFLIDYDSQNSIEEKEDIIDAIKVELLSCLNEKDSFNIIISNLLIKRYSDNWVPASLSNIDNAIEKLTSKLASYTNLPTLLANGIDFANNNAGGEIFLISNSNSYGSKAIANSIIEDLNSQRLKNIPIHICDYKKGNYISHSINFISYYGNEYLYSNLSEISKGSYTQNDNEETIGPVLSTSINKLSGSISFFDLYTDTQNGLCYNKYFSTTEKTNLPINTPIFQIGKYKGDLPFKVEFSGEFNQSLFSTEFQISKGNENQSNINQIWASYSINELEAFEDKDTREINQIITQSIDSRVLSRYTAFLCLEQDSMICIDCEDQPELVSTFEINLTQDSIYAYPNPFTNKLAIAVEIANPKQVKQIAIFSITGKLVYTFNVSSLTKGKNNLVWNADNSKPGAYILVYKSESISKSIKLFKQ